MKKAFNAVLAVVILFSLSGCQIPGRELSDTLIIQGIAIDTIENGYRVTAEALNNSKNTSVNGEGGGEKITRFYVSEDTDIAVALEKICMLSGKEPLYSHNRVIIIGERAAKSGIDEMLDFFIREYNTRATIPVVVAKHSDAEALLCADIGKDVVHAQMIEDVVTLAASRSQVLKARVLDAANMVLDKHSSLVVPAVSIQEDADEKHVSVTGTAVFDENNSLCSYLDAEESMGLVLLNNRAQKGMLAVELGEGYAFSFALEKLKTKTRIELDGDKVEFKLILDASCDVTEYSVPGGYGEINSKIVKELKKLCEEKLMSVTLKCINTVSGGYALDAFGFARYMRLTHTEDYNRLCENWASVIKNASYSISVNVTIRRVGEEAYV